MTNLHNLSIKRKLTLVNMVSSCAAIVVACAVFVTYDYVTFRQMLVHEVETMGDIVGGNTTAALSFDDRDEAGVILARLRNQPSVRTAAVFDAAGTLFASVVDPEAPVADCAIDGGAVITGWGLVVSRPIMLGAERVGTICIQSDLAALDARLQGYALILGLVLLLSSAVALVLSAGLQHLISAPILRLAETARTVSTDHNYAIRAEPGGHDELGALIGDFNGMLAQIEEQDASLREHREHLEEIVFGRR
jgi:methyl-accepting chemotaxis protein